MKRSKLTHAEKINRIVAECRKLYDEGFLKIDDLAPNWETYEIDLREELSHENAAQINATYKGMVE